MKKTNVEILKELNILGIIRERVINDFMGDHTEDSSEDDFINKMTPDQILREWCTWEIGDSCWYMQMKALLNILEENQKKEEETYSRAEVKDLLHKCWIASENKTLQPKIAPDFKTFIDKILKTKDSENGINIFKR